MGLVLTLGASAIEAMVLLGWARIAPGNLDWLQFDLYQAYLGLASYRLDPESAFALQTARLSHPLPMNIALFDANPLYSLLLKLALPQAPIELQFVGIYLVLCAALQGLFAYLLFHDSARRYQSPEIAAGFATLAALLVLTSPAFLMRWSLHPTLASHWVMIAALWLLVRADRTREATTLSAFAGLLALAGSMHPYLLALAAVIYLGYLVKAWQLNSTLTARRAALAAVPVIAGALSMAYFGFFVLADGGLEPTPGYGLYSANLLALINPAPWLATLFRRLPVAFLEQSEGYGYLGAGAMLLILGALALAWRKQTLRSANALPLMLVAAAGFLIALSTTVTFGRTVLLRLPLPAFLDEALGVFRALGRFIWLPHYALIVAGALLFAKTLRGRMLLAAVGACVFVQAVDLFPTWSRMHSYMRLLRTERLASPAWRDLGRQHRLLLVVPPWQCARADNPGGPLGFATLGEVALQNRLLTNSNYTARLPVRHKRYHCEEFIRTFGQAPLTPDVAYVLTPRVFWRASAALAERHFCDFADGMILCRADLGKTGTSAALEAARSR